MNNTSRHVVFAFGWLVGVPLLAVALFASGALPGAPFQSSVVSVVWGLGLVAIFASWALQDAPMHRKSPSVALVFTAAWFLLFVFAVFPYLFVTRGVKDGAVAALKFIFLCLGFAILWLGVPRLFAGIF